MTVGMYNTRSLDGFTYISTKEKSSIYKETGNSKTAVSLLERYKR